MIGSNFIFVGFRPRTHMRGRVEDVLNGFRSLRHNVVIWGNLCNSR